MKTSATLEAFFKRVDEGFIFNNASSSWLLSSLKGSLQRDPVDALNDCEVLMSLLREWNSLVLLDVNISDEKQRIQPEDRVFLTAFEGRVIWHFLGMNWSPFKRASSFLLRTEREFLELKECFIKSSFHSSFEGFWLEELERESLRQFLESNLHAFEVGLEVRGDGGEFGSYRFELLKEKLCFGKPMRPGRLSELLNDRSKDFINL